MYKWFSMRAVIPFIFILLLSYLAEAQTSSLNRPHDPVVLTGNLLQPLRPYTPEQIVGFRFNQGVWTQIPVQVDEKALLDIVLPYGDLSILFGIPPSYSNPKTFLFCDSSTYTGIDPLPLIDYDDELVFLAKDAGGESDGSFPQGVLDSICTKVTIIDPLGGRGYVYLLINDGSLTQNAGLNYITVSTDLPATSGFPTNLHITNYENTFVSTDRYSWHFSSEWVSDMLSLSVGNGFNLLDRHKCFLSDTSCSRTEDTFSEAENAFVISKTGPVRYIRSYMGANSGPLTQRTHIFYQGRQDIITDLRVHSIGGFYDTFDWNSSAEGMIYKNDLNPEGVVTDGIPDAIVDGDIQWEQLAGEQGTITTIHRRTTTISEDEAVFTSFYDDNLANPVSNCSGDGQSWAESGISVEFGDGICTDPLLFGCKGSPYFRMLQTRRTLYLDPPFGSVEMASIYNQNTDHPLEVTVGECGLVVSLSEIKHENEPQIYPNPGKGMLNIDTPNAVELSVFNNSGQKIKDLFVPENGATIFLENAGVYTLIFTMPGGNRVQKRVVVIR